MNVSPEREDRGCAGKERAPVSAASDRRQQVAAEDDPRLAWQGGQTRG